MFMSRVLDINAEVQRQ